MAYEIPLLDITRKSSGDMSGENQYKLVSFSTANSAQGCILGPTTAGGRANGVWQGDSTSAEYGKVRVLGVTKIQISTGSGPIVEGSPICGSTVDTLGFAQLATSTGMSQHIVGISLETKSSGSSGLISILLTPWGHNDG